jgi:CubicO group peptidase (beta-lactamase class C family)
VPRLPVIALLLVACLRAVAQNPNPDADLDAFIAGEMQAEHIPGMATVIVKDGEVVWLQAYGYADEPAGLAMTDSTVLLLASVSKLFTGTALMQLVSQGMVDPDADISLHLPFAVSHPVHADVPITARMLLTHTSSIADNYTAMDTYYSVGDPTLTLAEVMERYFSPSGADYSAQDNFLGAAPGTTYEYSNIASALAGYVVERVTQMPFDAYCAQHIFSPLCMDRTSWFLAGLDTASVARPHLWSGGQYEALPHMGFADYPNGLLRSDVRGLARFMTAYLQGGNYAGHTVLPPATVGQMLTPQVPAIEPTQGLSWYLEDIYLSGGGTVALWGHNGGEDGASTDVYIDPQNGIGVAVLSNAEGDNLYVVDALYDKALSLTGTGAGNAPCAVAVSGEAAPEALPLLFPNPTTGTVRLRDHGSLTTGTTATVTDAMGRLLGTYAITRNGTLTFDHLPNGLYQVRLATHGHYHTCERVAVMR